MPETPTEELSLEERLAPHLPKFLAALAATGAGLGAYRYLRRQRLSADPALRALQEASGGKYTHIAPGSRKQVGALGRALNKLLYAGGGAVEYADDLSKQKIPGTVFHEFASDATGDVNLFGLDTGKLLKKFRGADKAVEAKIFQKYAPGSMPDTTQMSSFLGARFGDRLKKYEDKLRDKYPGGYILKTIHGESTKGRFPSDAKSLGEYLAGGGHASEVVQQLLDDPSQVIAQAKIPIQQGNPLDRLWGALRGTPATRETRVHVFNGAVAPSLTVPRFSPFATISGNAQRREAENFVKDVLSRLPKDMQKGTYAFDVAPVVGGGFKIIESNPGHRSGFLSPQRNPLASYQLHRDLTGRHSRMTAGAGAALTAGGLGLAAHEATKDLDSGAET